MTSMVFQDSAAGVAVRYAPSVPWGRLRTRRRMILRLRRKIPSWTGLALLVLVADATLAVLAWGAVDLILR
jgi:hypothetical protein